jgi:arylsulfatase A-like enzyme
VPAGIEKDGMVEAVDLPCTLLEAAGCGEDPAKHLPGTPGRSFWSYVLGRCDAHRPWVYSELRTGAGGWRMCRERDWKYVFDPVEGDALYDMRADPWELDNLAAANEHADDVGRMRRQLVQSMMYCAAPDTDGGLHPREDWWRAPGEGHGDRETAGERIDGR